MYDPKLDPEMFENVQEEEDEEVAESDDEAVEVDDVSDAEDTERQARKRAKTASRIHKSKEQVPTDATTRSATTSNTLPLRPIEKKKPAAAAIVRKSESRLSAYYQMIDC